MTMFGTISKLTALGILTTADPNSTLCEDKTVE